jgi:hypothetical protein
MAGEVTRTQQAVAADAALDGAELLADARDLLAAWREGLARDGAVVAWADEVIVEMPSSAIPEWVLDLSMFGPVKCMSRPSSEFIAVPVPTFRRAVAVRAFVLDLRDTHQVQTFVEWIAGACMGENLEDPIVALGYYVDHLLDDCGLMLEAVALVRLQLPALLADLPPMSPAVLRALKQPNTAD